MKLILSRGGGRKPIELETKHRMMVLAGPNGAGKTTILKDISGVPPQGPRVFFDTAGPGVATDNSNLEPFLINHEIIGGFNLNIGSVPQLVSTSPTGLDHQLFRYAFGGSPPPSFMNQDLDAVKALITEEDVAIYNGDNIKEINKLYRSYRTRLARPSLGNLSQAFNEYHQEYAARRYVGQSKESIIAELGPSPWSKAQTVIDQLGIPYEIKGPDIDTELPAFSAFYLARKSDGTHVPGDRMSSGERAALGLYDIIAGERRENRIFLFDDIDGFLHAPLLRKFIDALANIIDEQNSFAIWVSHSPVLVQMCKDASFFYIEKYGAQPKAMDKAVLINELSAGELVVAENFASIFVEGADVRFYNRLFNALGTRNIINTSRQVRFISPRANKTGKDASCDAVNDIVTLLYRSGFQDRFRGLVDLDQNALVAHPEVDKLARYCKENYFFDPLNVYAWCLNNDMDCLKDLPKFDGLIYGMAHLMIGKLSATELQSIIDYFAEKLLGDEAYLAKLKDYVPSQTGSVILYGGIELKYPSFLLKNSGKDMKAPYNRMHIHFQEQHLSEQFLQGAYWPQDLVDTMQKFC